jgi:hypothetical protein
VVERTLSSPSSLRGTACSFLSGFRLETLYHPVSLPHGYTLEKHGKNKFIKLYYLVMLVPAPIVSV